MLRLHIRKKIKFNDFPRRFLTYHPHAFSIEEAAEKFQASDSRRIFSPIRVKSKEGIIPRQEDPLKKVLVPCFGVETKIASTSYSGQYGIDRVVYDTTTDSEGKTTTTTRIETDWYHISGVVGPVSYTPEDKNMTVYGGFSWGAEPIERALEGYRFTANLQPFDASLIDEKIHIDPFLKRSAIAQETANDRIRSEERGRIHADISNRSGYSQTRINSFNTRFHHFSLNTYLLPAYILQYPNHPARILPALSIEDKNIYGPKQYSVTKSVIASAVATSLFAILFPQFAIATRVAWVAGTSVLSALWAKYQGGSTQYTIQQHRIDKEIKNNETVSETIADKNRFHTTSRNFLPKPAEKLLLDAEFYKTLDLDPNQTVTKEIVTEAFAKRIKAAHPDVKGGSTAEARKIITAKKKFNQAFSEQPRRGFATYVPQRQAVKVPPRSVRDPNAHQLITMVIDQKDYKNALVMVEQGKVLPDGHDAGENTLITEIAKRGSVKDLQFAIDKLGCSVDTSCDCPVHNTALHYGAMRGDNGIVEELIKRKATTNLINSKGQTALDVASNPATQQLLISHGGVRHTTLEGAAGFFARTKGSTIGYSGNERTLISEQEKPRLMLPK